MDLILNNPYRIIGLLVGASAREQQRQLNRLKKLIEAEQNPEEDFSFPNLGHLPRTIENIEHAAAKLNLDNDKMNAALFWFYNGNEITDEPAFEFLKEGNLTQCFNIWSKLTASGEVTQKNASAFHNLSLLYLSGIVNGMNSPEFIYEKGLSLKIKFLESDFVKDFKAKATDENYQPTKKELQLMFLKQVQPELEKSDGISSIIFLDIITKQEFSAKGDYLKAYVNKPIEQIEKKIQETKEKRKANKSVAYNAGKILSEQTLENLMQLKSILGISNLKYSSISDKVSDEILQCGIDYFLFYRDSNTDPGSASMDLFKKAKLLAVGNIAKQRCQENTQNLQEWINDKPERERQKRIEVDLKFIATKLENFQNLDDTIENAKDLVDTCKPRLAKIKSELGTTDDFYLQISSAIVNNAQGMLVAAVNKAQEGFKNYNSSNYGISKVSLDSKGNFFQFEFQKPISIYELSAIVNLAYDVTTSMQSMDMVPNLRQSFQTNRVALGNIRSQINLVTRPTTSQPTSGSSSGNSGCYIATMAYGDYDHPQVMILRQFRDEVLDKSAFGKWFIKTYYYYSPKIVEKLKDRKATNKIIRKLLNLFIKLIK